MNVPESALAALAVVALVYFVLLNGIYLFFTAIAWRSVAPAPA